MELIAQLGYRTAALQWRTQSIYLGGAAIAVDEGADRAAATVVGDTATPATPATATSATPATGDDATAVAAVDGSDAYATDDDVAAGDFCTERN